MQPPWCKKRPGACLTGTDGGNAMDVRLAGSWGHLKSQRARKRDGKALQQLGGRTLDAQDFGSRCQHRDALCSGYRERHSEPRIPGYQYNLPPSPPQFPGTTFFPTCLLLSFWQEEFLLLISGPTHSPMAHKIIKTSPKLEQPLTLLPCSPSFRLTNQLCIINL